MIQKSGFHSPVEVGISSLSYYPMIYKVFYIRGARFLQQNHDFGNTSLKNKRQLNLKITQHCKEKSSSEPANLHFGGFPYYFSRVYFGQPSGRHFLKGSQRSKGYWINSDSAFSDLPLTQIALYRCQTNGAKNRLPGTSPWPTPKIMIQLGVIPPFVSIRSFTTSSIFWKYVTEKVSWNN